MLLWAELRLLRWARYTSAAGETLPGAPDYLEAHPAEKTIGTLFNTWTRLLEKLSITPATRRALEGRGESGPAATLAAAIRELSNELRTVEGEFTAEDADHE